MYLLVYIYDPRSIYIECSIMPSPYFELLYFVISESRARAARDRARSDWRRKPKTENPQKITLRSCDSPWTEQYLSFTFFEICARNYLCRNGFSFGMSAAFRVPLRAFANPATAIRQTSTTSIASPALSLRAVRPSSSPLGSIASKLWSRQSSEVRSQATSSSRCFSTRTSPLRSAEENVTSNEGVKSKPGPSQSKKPIALLVVLGLLGVGAAVYSEELKHGYGAARRSGRVVGTLAVCINE